MLLIVEVIWP